MAKPRDGMVGEPAAAVSEVLADDEDGVGPKGVEELQRVRHAGRGQHLPAVSGMDVEPVAGHAAGAVPLPKMAVVKYLTAVDLTRVEDGNRMDGDVAAGLHGCLLTLLHNAHELHDSIEQPARWRAHSGRLPAKVSLPGCSA